MTWLLVAYFVGLVWLALNQERIVDKGEFRKAWKLYAWIMVNYSIFALLKLIPFIILLSDCIAWLLIALSMFSLLKALVAEDSTAAEDKLMKEDIYSELEKEKAENEN